MTTHKENKVYVHILHWDSPLLAIAPLPDKIASAKQLTTGNQVEFTQNEKGIVMTVPPAAGREADRVIVLTLAE